MTPENVQQVMEEKPRRVVFVSKYYIGTSDVIFEEN